MWRRVQFVDISTEVLFESHGHKSEVSNDAKISDQRLLKLSLFEYMFKENAVKEDEPVIFIDNGYLFDSRILELGSGRGMGYEIIINSEGLVRELDEKRLITRIIDEKDADVYYYNENSNIHHFEPIPNIDGNANHCSIRIREELVFSKLLKTLPSHKNEIYASNNDILSSAEGNKKKVAILVPAKNSAAFSQVKDTPLARLLLTDLKKNESLYEFEVKIFVGYDYDDPVLSIESNHEFLKEMLPQASFEFIELPRTRWVTFIWNLLHVQAYHEGFDYFVQMNDDIELKPTKWMQTSMALFNGTGVVGFRDSMWPCIKYTQTIVNRNHYQIFSGQYFPLMLKNWFSDDWIKFVYRSKAKCNIKAHIKNGQEATRYCPCDDTNYKEALSIGKETIRKWEEQQQQQK